MCRTGKVYGRCEECGVDLKCQDLADMGLCNACHDKAYEDDSDDVLPWLIGL